MGWGLRTIAVAWSVALLAATARVPEALADTCHASHYCAICKCQILFRGDDVPTEVPVIPGAAPRAGCVCPYSRNIKDGRRCQKDDLIVGPGAAALSAPGAPRAAIPGFLPPGTTFQSGRGRAAPPLPGAPGLDPTPGLEPEPEALHLDLESIPREISFGTPAHPGLKPPAPPPVPARKPPLPAPGPSLAPDSAPLPLM